MADRGHPKPGKHLKKRERERERERERAQVLSQPTAVAALYTAYSVIEAAKAAVQALQRVRPCTVEPELGALICLRASQFELP